MRILHTIRSADPAWGGTIESVRQFTTAHLRQGHQVELVSLDSPDSPWAEEFPCPLHLLGPARLNYGHSPRYIPWIREHASRFDTVVVNGLWQYHGFGARRALTGSRTPYFVFPHGMLDPWFKRHYPLKHLKKWLYWNLAESAVLRDASAVFFTAEEEQRLAAETFGRFELKPRIVSLGVERPEINPSAAIEAFHDAFPGLRGKRFLLFLGRLHEKKGCHRLIEAFAEERKSAPELQLVMAGPGEDRYVESLHSLATKVLVEDHELITWTGMLRGNQKWGALAAADAFILPSSQENFGIAVVEALAVGTPVLISDRINIWREIKEDGAGIVGSPCVAGTRKILREWLEAPKDRRLAMRDAAGRCFEKRFEAAHAAREMIEQMRSEGVIESSGLHTASA